MKFVFTVEIKYLFITGLYFPHVSSAEAGNLDVVLQIHKYQTKVLLPRICEHLYQYFCNVAAVINTAVMPSFQRYSKLFQHCRHACNLGVIDLSKATFYVSVILNKIFRARNA